MFSRCNRPARLRVAVPGAGINRPGSLTTNFQPTKDERSTTKSLEAFIEFRTYFVPFIYWIFKLNWSIKSRKNAQMQLKFSRIIDFSARRFHRCGQICQIILHAQFQQVIRSSETASAWRHEKEVLLHRRSPNFELVEINSTLSCKVVSEQILTDFWRRQNRWVSYWCRGSFRDRQHLELKIDGRITRIFNCESLCGGSDYPKKSPTFTPTFKSSKTHSTLRGHSPSLCPRRTSILTVQAGRLKMSKPSPVLS